MSLKCSSLSTSVFSLAPPLLCLTCLLLSRGVTSNLANAQRRQSIGRVFKQMAKMGASGGELIVRADESELPRRLPSSPTLICLLISRRGCVLGLVFFRSEFLNLGDENRDRRFIKSDVFPFFFQKKKEEIFLFFYFLSPPDDLDPPHLPPTPTGLPTSRPH